MLTDSGFNQWFNMLGHYIVCIYIKSADHNKKGRHNYNPLDEALRDTQKISANYRYIETWLNMSADTFKKAIQNDNYIKHECWINNIYDFYKDT